MQVQPFKKTHRTALVIDARKGFAGSFKERAERLLQSVNGSNIKVDVFHIVGDTVTAGAPKASAATASASTAPVPGEITLIPGAPGQYTIKGATVSLLDELTAWSAKAGYDQLILTTPGK